MDREPPACDRASAQAVEAEVSEVMVKIVMPGASGLLVLGLVLQWLQAAGKRVVGFLPSDAPLLMMRTGLLSLISLPIFRVGAAFVGFMLEQDLLFLALTGAVLVLLMYSFRLATPF